MKATYRDVKSDILSRIVKGQWGPGALLPGEVQLAETYGCARATVNRAMRELVEDGIIERRRKAGTRVRQAPARQARFDIPLVRAEIEEKGTTYRYTLLARVTVPAPDWLSKRFSLPANSPVLHLQCLHHADTRPYQHEDRWINLSALPEAAEADFSAQGPNEWLVNTVPYSNAEISFSACVAGKDLAEHLKCPPGEAVFVLERATWWEGRPVTFVRLTHPPGHKVTTRY